MNITIEKVKDLVISNNEIEKNNETKKISSSKDQLSLDQSCLKMLDYFVF
jgi:hypothetical protein